MANLPTNKLLEELSDAVLDGKSDRALELVDEALARKISFDDIVAKSILTAHLAFNEWYDRDKIGSLKAWEFCFFTTRKVLNVLDSRIPVLEKPPFSVVVATVHAEGHITMRDVIATMLRAKGLKVYGMKKGIIIKDIEGPLADPSLRYIALSCSEDATIPALTSLISAIRTKRPDVKIIAGGAIAPKVGADAVLRDPLRLYPTIIEML
jgi:methanogenic corrinoid protein MtbC1